VAIAPGIPRLRRELPVVLSAEDEGRPMLARTVVTELQARLLELAEGIAGHERQIAQVARQQEAAKRRMRVAGVGPITATALVATVGDAKAFSHGRQFAAWVKSLFACKQVRQQTRHSDGISCPQSWGAPARSVRRGGAGDVNCGSVVVRIH